MLIDPAGDDPDPLQFSRFLTEHLREQRKLYRAMMQGGSGPIILSSLRASICEVVRDGLRKQRKAPPDEVEVQFIVGAYVAVATWWLDRGAKEPVAVIDGRFRELAMGALAI